MGTGSMRTQLDMATDFGVKYCLLLGEVEVREGMVVRTQTEKVRDIRRFVLDLILAIHPLDCMTCTKAGICKLQEYAYEYELKGTSFTRKKMGYPIDQINPFIRKKKKAPHPRRLNHCF